MLGSMVQSPNETGTILARSKPAASCCARLGLRADAVPAARTMTVPTNRNFQSKYFIAAFPNRAKEAADAAGHRIRVAAATRLRTAPCPPIRERSFVRRRTRDET